MTTIGEAFLALEGETEESVGPIFKFLTAQGYKLDEPIATARSLLEVDNLDEELLRHNLTLRQRTVIKIVIKGRRCGICRSW